MIRTAFRLCAAILLLSAAGSLAADSPELVSLEKISDRADDNSFTVLPRYTHKWIGVCRAGKKHAGGDNGAVRVLVSPDGESWKSSALLVAEGLDLRDPKISVTPDGRLMLLMGVTLWKDMKATREICSAVSFSADGHNWTPRKQVLSNGHWLWRVTWHKQAAFGVSKLGQGNIPKQGFLWKSSDGVHYELLHKFKVPGMSETTLRFAADGKLTAMVRRTGPGGGNGWIGTSRSPYHTWTFKETDRKFGGPNFLILPNGQFWATSRLYGKGEYRRTALFEMTPESIKPVLTLPSGGDTSYAGMVWHDGLLWISYYSSHEEKPSIYLAKIRLAQ